MGEIIKETLSRPDVRILYVTVLYNRKLKDTQAFKTLLCDREVVYIQDNSPQIQNPGELPEGWVYRSCPENPGLSRAYNDAARYAVSRGFTHMMITDQDTSYHPGAAERYEAAAKGYPEERILMPKVKVGESQWLSPVNKRNYFSRLESQPLTGRVDLARTAVINSGLLVNLRAFEAAGGYNEKVFLDFSDLQFIDRLSRVCPEGLVLDEEIRQSFSARDDSGASQLSRFGLFCRSLRGFETPSKRDRMMIGLVAAKRCLSLCLQQRSLKPAGIYMREYLKRKTTT